MVKKILSFSGATIFLFGLLSFGYPVHHSGDESNFNPGYIMPASIQLPYGYNDLFAGSGECLMCHNSMVNQQNESVSIIADWRSSMMAHSAKDPLWQAKVSHEIQVNPLLENEIQTVCTRCHAPQGNLNAFHNGQEHYTLSEMREDPLAMDGVSCTVCHQIPPNSLGNFSGTFEVGTNKQIWGPYENPFTNPMINHTGYTPVHGTHIKDSRLCASCHTLLTASLDLEGNPTGEEFVEQAVYQEWLNSSYPEYEVSCQECHIPEIDDVVKISSMPPSLAGRTPFGMHHLAGANTFMLKLIKDNLETLGITASEEQMDSTISRATRMLQQSSIFMEVEVMERTEDTLFVDANLMNLAGHKFPTGFPSRRAFLQIEVHDENNNLIFSSGALDEDFNLIHEDENYEYHHQTIRNEEEVQIYEMVMGNVDYQPTTVLERAYIQLKDNRIPPYGFNTEHFSYDSINIAGQALDDPDFNFSDGEEGSGADIIHYHIPIGGLNGNLFVQVKLFYQTIHDKWLENMFSYSSDEIDLFKSMYDAADKTPVKVAEKQVISFQSGLEVKVKESFNVYPNPNNGDFYLNSHHSFSQINIISGNGEMIYSQIMNPQTNTEIKLNGQIDPGLYYMQVINNSNIIGVVKLLIIN